MKQFIILSICVWFVINTNAQFKCNLNGKVVNRTSKVLFLKRSSENIKLFMNNPNPIKIYIHDGSFNYNFQFKETEAYELIFEDELLAGVWVPIRFFPSNGDILFTLHPKSETSKNTVKGGELNNLYSKFLNDFDKEFGDKKNQMYKLRDSLQNVDDYESTEYKNVLIKLRSVKPNNQDVLVPIYQKMDELEKTYARYSENAKSLFVYRFDSLINASLIWKYEYVKKNISLVSYYLIYSDAETQIRSNPILPRLIQNVFNIYSKKYPNHVYTESIRKQLESLKSLQVGNKFIDIKMPSLSGDTASLSNLLKDKYVLIDFWGSWCGPCIAKSRLIVPLYEKYRSKGFDVIGVAREFENLKALQERLIKEKFSWSHYFDLDDKMNIWKTYGINNGVGLMILVDPKGTIVSIDPKVEELEKILKEKLN